MNARCPTCSKVVNLNPDNHWRPFCSERCRLIDLGDWMSESHRIPSDEDVPASDTSDYSQLKH